MVTLPKHKSEGNLEEQDIQFICSTIQVEEALREASESPHRWSYFANYDGIMKTYPSTKVDCGNYDPRFRPWYVAATSGRKNVIVIIDVSGSMSQGAPKRISLAKDAA